MKNRDAFVKGGRRIHGNQEDAQFGPWLRVSSFNHRSDQSSGRGGRVSQGSDSRWRDGTQGSEGGRLVSEFHNQPSGKQSHDYSDVATNSSNVGDGGVISTFNSATVKKTPLTEEQDTRRVNDQGAFNPDYAENVEIPSKNQNVEYVSVEVEIKYGL
jgi:hypothetical protein